MGANSRLKKQIQKKADESNEPQDMALGQKMADPTQKGGVSENKIRQVETITAMFMKLIHGEETRDSVLQTLGSNPDPGKAVPQAANMLMTRVEQQAKTRRQKLPDDVKVAAAQYMVPDLAMLGNRAGVWEQPVAEEQLPQMLQDTMQIYIRQGLKNKTIDPVQLQRDAEKLMTPEQKEMGMRFGGGEIPPGPTPGMLVDKKVDEAVGKERAKSEQALAQVEALKGGMRSQAAAPAEQNAALQGPA